MADEQSPPNSPSENKFSTSITHSPKSEGKEEDAAPSEPQTPAISYSHTPSHLQNFLSDAVEAANPPLRHLASHSTLGSLRSHGTSDVRSSRTRRSNISSFGTLSTNFEEQRHVGKPGLSITRSTKEWDPIVAHAPKSSISSFPGHSKRFSAADQSFVTQSAVSTQVYSETPLVPEDHRQVSEERLESQEQGKKAGEQEDDENIYPGPLPLTILIIGLCLSVFLISLDRTIITTVR